MYLHTHSSGNSHLWIRDYIGTMHLEQVRFQPESCLTGTGSANDQHILIPGIAGILWTVAHHQPFRLCQDHIILKNRIFKWFYVFMRSPSCRSIFGVVPKLLRVLASHIDCKPEQAATADPNGKIQRIETWERITECRSECSHQR